MEQWIIPNCITQKKKKIFGKIEKLFMAIKFTLRVSAEKSLGKKIFFFLGDHSSNSRSDIKTKKKNISSVTSPQIRGKNSESACNCHEKFLKKKN